MEFSVDTVQGATDITDNIEQLVNSCDIVEGVCHVFVKSTTSAIIINENNDPNLPKDILKALDAIVPQLDYLHDMIDNNALSHIKSSLLGCEKTIPIKKGRLNLGTWQRVMLIELDGPRKRQISVQVIPD